MLSNERLEQIRRHEYWAWRPLVEHDPEIWILYGRGAFPVTVYEWSRPGWEMLT